MSALSGATAIHLVWGEATAHTLLEVGAIEHIAGQDADCSPDCMCPASEGCAVCTLAAQRMQQETVFCLTNCADWTSVEGVDSVWEVVSVVAALEVFGRVLVQLDRVQHVFMD